jgi:NO-binding membrane sensor protein with MHYT domain
MNDRTASLRISFVLCVFGVMSLLSMLSRPSLASVRAVDVVHLIGTGMCFGAGIVTLVGYFRGNQG